jgi:ABC-type lipoprotein export system ATPase subunit
MQKAILTTHALCQKFVQGNEEVIVLNNIDSFFTQEKSYAITGISGSGKSTFIHSIAGLEKYSSGTVSYNGKALNSFSAADLCHFRNSCIGLVFQYPHLLRELSVIENVMLPGLISGKTKNHCNARAEMLLHKMGILEKKDAKPGQLSGGQQQRVGIARALFNQPTFLIADEPTGNLDLATGQAIINLLVSLHHEWGMGLIISSHDSYVTEKMDHVYQLNAGTLHLL